MIYRLFIWVMRFVLLGMIYIFLYKVIKVMYSDIKGDSRRKGTAAGLEVVSVEGDTSIPVGSLFPLHDITSIGRLKDNIVVLDSSFVSGHHAKIYLKNNVYYIKDVGSTNGTYVNGTKIDSPMVINNDDLIGIGGITFKVIL